jgi:hypothetical protein
MLQNLVAKNCKIWLRKFVKYRKYSLVKFAYFQYVCITCGNCYTIFEPKMVTISARNTNILKIYANFARLYFLYFTTFHNQILQFY